MMRDALDVHEVVPDNQRRREPQQPEDATSDAERAGGRMGKPHKLFNKFTNRTKRAESDCAVIQEIVDDYQNSSDESSRKESLKWLFETMEDKDTKKVARERIVFLLKAIQDQLPGKKRRRLEKYERKVEAKRTDTRAERFASEKTVVQQRIERKKRKKGIEEAEVPRGAASPDR